jgi:uncharacterized protein YegP (UPF0339 family)
MTDTNVTKIEVYQDAALQWRWRALAGNNEIVTEGEAHTTKRDAIRAAEGVFPGVVVEGQ